MFIEKEIAGPDLEQHGIRNVNAVHANLGAAQLVEHALERHEGHLAANKAKAAATASAIALVQTKMGRGESTDGAVFFATDGKPLGPGRLVIRTNTDVFDFTTE